MSVPDFLRDEDFPIKLGEQMEAVQRREVEERGSIRDDCEHGGSRFPRLRSSTASAPCVPRAGSKSQRSMPATSAARPGGSLPSRYRAMASSRRTSDSACVSWLRRRCPMSSGRSSVTLMPGRIAAGLRRDKGVLQIPIALPCRRPTRATTSASRPRTPGTPSPSTASSAASRLCPDGQLSPGSAWGACGRTPDKVDSSGIRAILSAVSPR